MKKIYNKYYLVLTCFFLLQAPLAAEVLRMRKTDLLSVHLYTVPEFHNEHSAQFSELARGFSAVREISGNPAVTVKPSFWIVSSRSQMETVLKESFRTVSEEKRREIAAAGVFKNRDRIIMILRPDLPAAWVKRILFTEYARYLLDAAAPSAQSYNIGWFYAGLSVYNGWRAAALIENKTDLQFHKEFRDYFASYFDSGNASDLADIEKPDDWKKGILGNPESLFAQSALVYQYLAEKEGDAAGINVLKLYNSETYFDESFRRVYGFSLKEFEDELRQKLYPSLSKLKKEGR